MKNRKPNRLKNYDYSQNGLYFITICTKDREEYFGKIGGGRMVLNETGRIIYDELNKLEINFQNLFLDEYVIMPNHLHVIFEIKNKIISDVGADLVSAQKKTAPSLSRIIQAFKSKTTVEYIKLMKRNDEIMYKTKIWQRSFYDHIIRNEISLNKIREYIETNPEMWERDRNNIENLWM